MSPQPNLPQYPISALYTVPTYPTIAAAVDAGIAVGPGGLEPYNPALPIKNWVGSGTVDFFSGDAYGKSAFEMEFTVPDTSTGLNIPGQVSLPAYVVAPTPAVMDSPYGAAGSPVAAINLSTEADAQALVSAVTGILPGAIGYVDTSASMEPLYIPNWNGETRRLYKLTKDGAAYGYVGNWIIDRNAAGVGNEGVWVYDVMPGNAAGGKQLFWKTTPQVLTASASTITLPTPVRALLPNEEFVWLPSMNPLAGVEGVWMVQRTDLAAAGAALLAEIQELIVQYNAIPGVTAIPMP